MGTNAFLLCVASVIFTVTTAASSRSNIVCTQKATADIVFLVDGSGSVQIENFQKVKQFLVTMVDNFNVGPDHVQFGLIQYNSSPRTEFLLKTFQSKGAVLQSIRNLQYMSGGTRTGQALTFMRREHFAESAGSRAREGVPQIAVVLTDGASGDQVKAPADELRRNGVTVYAIGIRGANQNELREIGNTPHDRHVFSVSNFDALQEISESIIQELCTVVDPCKEKDCRQKEDCVLEKNKPVCVAQSKAYCWAMGDPTYQTFDNSSFSFQGTCSYTLVKTTGRDDTLTPFSIVTKSERRGSSHGAYLKSARIKVKGHEITVPFGNRGSVMIDGTYSRLPVSMKSDGINMAMKGFQGTIETDFGLEVSFDWGELFMVTVSSSYYENLAGLCGTYNNNKDDDFTTPAGVHTTDIKVWAQSWSTDANCVG